LGEGWGHAGGVDWGERSGGMSREGDSARLRHWVGALVGWGCGEVWGGSWERCEVGFGRDVPAIRTYGVGGGWGLLAGFLAWVGGT
jgi:hypothetical protein